MWRGHSCLPRRDSSRRLAEPIPSRRPAHDPGNPEHPHQAEFVDAVGWVFEHSPWVAERAWESRPFATLEALHAAMRDRVEAAGQDEKMALLLAHPDLGTRAPLTAASQSEQA